MQDSQHSLSAVKEAESEIQIKQLMDVQVGRREGLAGMCGRSGSSVWQKQ